MDIELLYFVFMIAAFLIGILILKLPTGISMMIGAFVGMVIFCLGDFKSFLDLPRHIIDGGLGYIDPILTIAFAMIFMKSIEAIGTLDKIGVFVLEKFKKFPTLLLISLMIILLIPGMITGSSATAVVTSGTLVAPILLAIGVPKKETIAIVAIGAILGMIAPPINIPVMVICDITDMPFIGFELPLLLITLPVAIFSVLFLGRKHIGKIDIEEIKDSKTINFDIKNEVGWTVYIPLIILIVLLVIVNAVPQLLPPIGMPLVFFIATIPALFLGKKANLVKVSRESMKLSLPVMAMLVGVGMLVSALTWTGVRGMIVYYVMTLNQVTLGNKPILLYLGSALALPIVGTISPFASATIFGGPFVMGLKAVLNPIIIASCMSMLASIGDLVPPSALAGRTCCEVLKYEQPYQGVLKKMIIPIAVIIVYTTLFMIFVGQFWQ